MDTPTGPTPPSHLSNWPLLSILDREFLKVVKTALVFGSTGNEALLVTLEDDVYALGANCNNCLGVGDSRSSLQPRRVEQLCKKGVIDLAYGSGPHVVALTATGDLYTWGHNGYGQLGLGGVASGGVANGSLLAVVKGGQPERVAGGLGSNRERIMGVACGGHHTLAITSEGEVYAWGYNNCGQLGSGNYVNQPTPWKVQGALSSMVCSTVSCGHACSVAVTKSGELYTWGYNGNGQLGIGNNTNQSSPTRVHLPGVYVAQVVCSYAHTMALSDEGQLFAWGSNVYGQLGTGTKTNVTVPVQVGMKLGRFTAVAAYHNNHLSAATVVSGKVYMWGMCRGQSVLLPMETNAASLDNIFSSFSSTTTMWRALVLERQETENGGLVSCISGRFNDVDTSDLTIVVEGKTIYVHRAILRMRCEYFYSMFQQGRWNEAEKDSIEICHSSYSVYHAFLKYLYTDNVEGLDTEDIIGLLDLADSYCETHLKKRCERLIRQRVTVGNVASLFAVAAKYKTEVLEDHCFKFALNHMTQVVQSESFAQLDNLLAKEFIQKAAKHGAFKT